MPKPRDPLLAELRSVPDTDPGGGFTSIELEQRTGMTRERILRRLGKLKASGRLEVKRVRREALDGAFRWFTVYRLVCASDGGEEE